MNKKDLILLIVLLIIACLISIVTKQEKGNTANVYYDGNLVLKINLSKNKNYDVTGFNGNVHIKVKDNYLSVTDEISPYHLCQKKKIHNIGESLICLPNKVVIKIESNDLDGVVG